MDQCAIVCKYIACFIPQISIYFSGNNGTTVKTIALGWKYFKKFGSGGTLFHVVSSEYDPSGYLGRHLTSVTGNIQMLQMAIVLVIWLEIVTQQNRIKLKQY